jgi:transposase
MALEGATMSTKHRTSSEGAGALEAQRKKRNGKQYDKPFKIAAAKLVTEKRYTPKQAAASLGVPVNTLQYWIKVFGRQPQEQAETMDSLRLKNKQLEAENQRLRLEREILKKATAFFASQQS